jgi:hypothetical protein
MHCNDLAGHTKSESFSKVCANDGDGFDAPRVNLECTVVVLPHCTVMFYGARGRRRGA